MFEHEFVDFKVDAARSALVKQAMKDFEKAVPCVKFRRIAATSRWSDADFVRGHYIHIMKPMLLGGVHNTYQNWCKAQNGGNRRRMVFSGGLHEISKRKPNQRLAEEIELAPKLFDKYLAGNRSQDEAFDGPTLLWLGYCDSSRWLPRIIQQLGSALGMKGALGRADAAARWQDPWSLDSIHHDAHIEVKWSNVASGNAKKEFSAKDGAYTGSISTGLLDPFNGYADYDFFSIEHPDVAIHASNASMASFVTKPDGVYDSVVGSSKSLSDGDVSMLADLYQCNTDRYFMQQGYRKGEAVTSLHYEELSNLVMSDIASTQAWTIVKDRNKLDDWINDRRAEEKWQLSFVRYMPASDSFIGIMDTNRWSRRRSSGKAVQKYSLSTKFSSFREWILQSHADNYVITDLGADGKYLAGVMTQFPAASKVKQSVFWSTSWTRCVEQIRSHARMKPSYALTNLALYSAWANLGRGCCASAGRNDHLIFVGGPFNLAGCKQKCLEYANCGAIDINSTGHCTVFSNDYSCDKLDLTCNSGNSFDVIAWSHSAEWIVAMTAGTAINAQFLKMSSSEQDAIAFVNQAFANTTTPARVTSLVGAHWGGFVTIMSVSNGTKGPPYWTTPSDRTQRFTVNQPYEGYVGF
jgi:hypothetical protein